ncbi:MULTISPECIES: CPBP family intramembrane glutamic endopeptidase [Clostridium]|uniref:CPBP family intramembrane glutamic endopeptidase n=1 Tax=Clostridium TaxID=1485 RepID=UPI0015E1B327|nr:MULTISPECIES: CPBP family intramembrane glutamic endopeptidase [Clostridium]MBN7576291.1 CPBP family intramembrane metalloprotease [Clostridium beijerinckii]MBN7579705.1 CPBP family intramembrane metalloprotease [Clostridium beijerinckii]MBN7585364.1 CPBP family intramembrane metalloprotease [Clostridium beijerinckii]MBO0520793.1 CPBP family intramembrane metalloprotease [Clostridium beijerinckii]
MECVHKDDNEIKGGISIWESIMILLLIIGLQVIGGIFIAMLMGILNIASGIKILDNTYASAIGNMIAYIIIYKSLLKKNKFDIKLKCRFDIKITIYCLFILIGYILTYDNTISLIVQNLVSESWIDAVFTEMLQTPFAAFCSMVFIAPIFEELFMRGIILEQLSRRYKPIISITVSALLFAILHLNVIQGINAFLLGIILGLVYLKTRNLIITILLHGLNNLFCYIVSYFPELYKVDFSPIKLAVGVVLLVISLYIFKRFEISRETDKTGEEAL